MILKSNRVLRVFSAFLLFIAGSFSVFATDGTEYNDIDFKTKEQVDQGISNQLDFLIDFNKENEKNDKSDENWYVYIVGEDSFNASLFTDPTYVKNQLVLDDIAGKVSPLKVSELNTKLTEINKSLLAKNLPLIYFGVGNRKKAIPTPFFPYEEGRSNNTNIDLVRYYFDKSYFDWGNKPVKEVYYTLLDFEVEDKDTEQQKLLAETLALAGDNGAIALSTYYLAFIKKAKTTDPGKAQLVWWSYADYAHSDTYFNERTINFSAIKEYIRNHTSSGTSTNFTRIDAWHNYLTETEEMRSDVSELEKYSEAIEKLSSLKYHDFKILPFEERITAIKALLNMNFYTYIKEYSYKKGIIYKMLYEEESSENLLIKLIKTLPESDNAEFLEYIAGTDVLRTLDGKFSDVEISFLGDQNYNKFVKLIADIWKKNIQEQVRDHAVLASGLFNDNKIFRLGYVQNFEGINCESSVKSSFPKTGNLTVDVEEPVALESIPMPAATHMAHKQWCSTSSNTISFNSPFDPVLVSFGRGAKIGSQTLKAHEFYLMPAYILHYIAQEDRNKKLALMTEITIDVALLASGVGGGLNLIVKTGMTARRVLVTFDVLATSGDMLSKVAKLNETSICGNDPQCWKNVQTIQKATQTLAIIAGLSNLGESAFKKIAERIDGGGDVNRARRLLEDDPEFAREIENALDKNSFDKLKNALTKLTEGMASAIKSFPANIQSFITKLPDKITHRIAEGYLTFVLHSTDVAKVSKAGVFSEIKWVDEGQVIKLTDDELAKIDNVKISDQAGNKEGTIAFVETADGLGGVKFINTVNSNRIDDLIDTVEDVYKPILRSDLEKSENLLNLFIENSDLIDSWKVVKDLPENVRLNTTNLESLNKAMKQNGYDADYFETLLKSKSDPQKFLDDYVSKIGDNGKFVDNALESDYTSYLTRKAREGKPPRDRADWNHIRDYMLNDSPLARGNAFNETARIEGWYPFDEVTLANGKRVDSYRLPEGGNPGEIVSRKATDLGDIQLSTFDSYLSEMKVKYAPGTPINAPKYGNELKRKVLEGDLILELPDSNLNLSNIQDYIDLAKIKGITLRFKPE